MKTAFMYSTFPHLSTTFLQRELRGLKVEGFEPLLVSNRRPGRGNYHPEDAELLRKTFYLDSVNPFDYLRANLKAFFLSPRKYFKGLSLALALPDGGDRKPFRNLSRLAGAAVLAAHYRRQGIAHAHVHFAFGAAGIAIFNEVLAHTPYSLSIHGSDVLIPQPYIEEKLKRARFVISNCKYHVSFLRRRFPSLETQRFHVLPLGLDLQEGLWAKRKSPPPLPPLRILTVARLHPVKGLPVLIKACAHLKKNGVKFICRIVGDGPEKPLLKSLISDSGLAESVILMGALYEKEVAEQLDWCHVKVLSSLSEGTPMSVIEAMASARPVIAPDITGIPEMVLPGETGFLFQRGSDIELSKCLLNFSGNPELVTRMGVEGRKRAEDLFSLSGHCTRMLDIFHSEGVLRGSWKQEE